MRSKPLIAVAALTLLLLVGGYWLLTFPSEPSYQDKKLSSWLKQLDFSYRPQDVQASNAIYQMHTNILPFLGPMLRAHDSKFKLAAVRLLSKQSFIRLTFTPAEEKRQQASRACRILGPSGSQFLPELTAMLDSYDHRTAWCGFVAIGVVKPGAQRLPELNKALTNGYYQVRSSAASQLGNLKAQASTAVPALISSLNDSNADVRTSVIEALTRIRPDMLVLLPALMSGLDDPSPSVRGAAAWGLGQIGIDAEPAKTKLLKRLEDSDEAVRHATKNALQNLLEDQQHPGARP